MSAAMAWSAYALAISALLGMAAWVVEASAREVGRATRWGWVAAMIGSVVLPLAAYFDAPVSGGAMIPPGLVVTLSPIVAGVDGGSGSWSADRWLLLLWAVTSAAGALYVLRAGVWLRRARSRWTRQEIEGVAVWMTRDVGPAVFGVGGAEILVPAWVLGLDRRVRRLLLLHEKEHVRAGDPRLVLAGIALVVLVPWNPVFWWMLGRLRLAVEMDCDARVLRREPDARAYGSLLLEVSRRRLRSPLLVAFSEPHRFLERRIRRITAKRARHAGARAGLLAVFALAPVLVAMLARDPLAAVDAPLRTRSATAAAQQQDTLRPTFTPFTVAPRLRNSAEVSRALQENYPPLLRDGGIGGDVLVWFFIDETGVVRKTQLNQSSGHPALDAAAMRVADVMEFTPARNRAEVVSVWVSIPIRFRSGAGGGATQQEPARRAAAADPAAGAARAREDRAAGQAPTFTPFTRAPRLLNTDDVRQSLEKNYPPLLRDAGIGGEASVWVFVDVDGIVSRMQLDQSTGYEALDDAALRVAAVMRFSPADNRGRPVATWVSVPVRFEVR